MAAGRKCPRQRAHGCLPACLRSILPCLPQGSALAQIRRRRRSLRTVEDKEEYDFALQHAITTRISRLLCERAGLPKEGVESDVTTCDFRGRSIQEPAEVFRSPNSQSDRFELSLPVTFDTAEGLRGHYERHSGGAKPVGEQQLRTILELFGKGYHSRHPSAVAEVDVPPAPGKLVVVGDTHGQLKDVLMIFRVHGPPRKDNVYIFNGDIADRGPNAIEIYLLLAAYFLSDPSSVIVNRGNHEDVRMNAHPADEGGGFYDEVRYKFNTDSYVYFYDIFRVFSLCTVIGKKVFVVHGGLPSFPNLSLDTIRRINHTSCAVPDHHARDLSALEKIWVDMLWSDPHHERDCDCLPSDRGVGCHFGPAKTREFLQTNGIKLVVRSHELPESNRGIERCHGNRCVTVFSASNYCGDSANTAGVLIFTEGNFPNGDGFEYYAPVLNTIARLSGEKAPVEQWIHEGEMLYEEHNSDTERDEAAWRKELLKVMVAIVERKPDIWDKFMEVTHGVSQTIGFAQFKLILSSVLITKWNWEAAWRHWGFGSLDSKVNFADFLRRFTVVLTKEEFTSFKLGAVCYVYHKLLEHDMTMKEAIKQFDTDGDGHVTIAETRAALHSLAVDLTKSQLDVIIHGVFGSRDRLRAEDFFAAIALVFRRSEDQLETRGGTEAQRALEETSARIAHVVAVTPLAQIVAAVPTATAAAGSTSVSWRASTRSSLASSRGGGLSDLARDKFAVLFRAMDSDSSGEIDINEFVSGLWRLPAVRQIRLSSGQPVTQDLLKQLARWLDKNGSGQISIFEFLASFEVEGPLSDGDLGDALAENMISVLLRHRNSIRAGVALFDKSGSGFISPEKFRQVLSALNDTIEETGHHWSPAQIDSFCEAMTVDNSECGVASTSMVTRAKTPLGSYVEYETIFDSLQVVDSQFPDTGVRLGRGHKLR